MPTGTGTPGPSGPEPESFWEKNKWYIIGIGGGVLFILIILVIVGIMRARRNSGDLPDDGTGDGTEDYVPEDGPGDYLLDEGPVTGPGSEIEFDETTGGSINGSSIRFGF